MMVSALSAKFASIVDKEKYFGQINFFLWKSSASIYKDLFPLIEFISDKPSGKSYKRRQIFDCGRVVYIEKSQIELYC